MPELDYYKLSLDNWIAGIELAKETLPRSWRGKVEQRLELLKGIRDLLERIEEKEEE